MTEDSDMYLTRSVVSEIHIGGGYVALQYKVVIFINLKIEPQANLK